MVARLRWSNNEVPHSARKSPSGFSLWSSQIRWSHVVSDLVISHLTDVVTCRHRRGCCAVVWWREDLNRLMTVRTMVVEDGERGGGWWMTEEDGGGEEKLREGREDERRRWGCWDFTKLPPVLLLKWLNCPWCGICVKYFVFTYHFSYFKQSL